MKTLEDIREVVSKPSSFLKSDLMKASFIELYSFLPLEDLPENFTKHLSEEAKKNWHPNYEEDILDINDDIKDEINYLFSMLKEDLVNETVFRFPRLLSLLWVKDIDVTVFDEELFNMSQNKVTKTVAVKRCKAMLRKIRKLIK